MFHTLKTKFDPVIVSATLTCFTVAAAPIFIRLAQQEGVPSLSIISMRLILGAVLLTPFALSRHSADIQAMTRRQWLISITAGAIHALGIILLFYGLQYSSILINGVMRRTSPIWSIMIEVAFLGMVFHRRMWLGLLATLVGSFLLVYGTAGAIEPGSAPVWGGILSAGNAVAFSIYLIIGRMVRNELPFLAYTWVLFTSAAVVALIIAIVTQSSFLGYTPLGYFWIVIVTLVSQIIGHLSANYAVRHYSVTYLTVIMQVGVVLAAVVAFFVFGEVPSLLQIIGSIIILGGVAWVSLRQG
jgi:drug/metabolite transporter (DMT)-like permease